MRADSESQLTTIFSNLFYGPLIEDTTRITKTKDISGINCRNKLMCHIANAKWGRILALFEKLAALHYFETIIERQK